MPKLPSRGRVAAITAKGQTDLSEPINNLNSLKTTDLKKQWRRSYRTPPPDGLSRDLLIRGVAYRLQEKALGGLTGAVKRKLKLLAQQAQPGGALEAFISLKPGTKLVRSWHGKTFTITVLQDGFEYDGKRYGSLSQIACLITGTRWSGPRFFGLKSKPRLPPRIAPAPRVQRKETAVEVPS